MASTAHPLVAPAAGGAEMVLAPEVVFVEGPDGSARLLDLEGGFYAIPQSGAELLRETLADGTASAAVRIAERYGVDTEQVEQDLSAFLTDLRRRRLICRPGSPPRGRTRRLLCRLMVTLPLLALLRLVPSLSLRAWLLLALARCSFWLFGWSATVATWGKVRGVPRPTEGCDRVVTAVGETVRRMASGHLMHVECKERAVCCWALLRAGGWPAALVVGVRFFPMIGHCWCASGSHVLADSPDNCAACTTVFTY